MSTVSTIIRNPNSFHPISRITFNLELYNAEAGRCSLHLLYKLIPSVFIDPYELAQRQASYTFIKWGPTELEKPTHAVQDSDTNVLLTINLPLRDEEAKIVRFDVDVPLHARYLAPLSKDAPLLDSKSYRHLPLERPQAFLACPRKFGRESSSAPPAHISASQLAEVKLMLNTTDFIHIPYSPNNPTSFIRIPVGRKRDLAGVQIITATVVLFTFLCIGVVVIQTSKRLFAGPSPSRPKMD